MAIAGDTYDYIVTGAGWRGACRASQRWPGGSSEVTDPRANWMFESEPEKE